MTVIYFFFPPPHPQPSAMNVTPYKSQFSRIYYNYKLGNSL
nr:MAG TPA: hypothetical protein [Caudoviricetes sp.]